MKSYMAGTKSVQYCNNINIDIDRDIFVNMKDINNIRRLLCDKLITTRSNTKRDIIINKY